jgi:hypothetical protein
LRIQYITVYLRNEVGIRAKSARVAVGLGGTGLPAQGIQQTGAAKMWNYCKKDDIIFRKRIQKCQ